jgi:dienelactone hydrolase
MAHCPQRLRKLPAFAAKSSSRLGSVMVAAFRVVAAATLAVSTLAAAQTDAPGELVTIPGVEISGWGQVAEVRGRFGRPARSTSKAPAVLILHGSGGVDGRGAFYAKALEDAGIATLEITMFQRGGRPRAGQRATMPHAAASLSWLATRPDVNRERLGIMGFSWGGVMSVLLSSEIVQERLGKNVPKPAALAPFYPVCTNMARFLANPQHPFYNAHTRMSATPMLIHVGTRDDYEQGERPCDALVAMWPAAARERATVRYVEDATHGFDSQIGSRQFFDEFARAGRGGTVTVYPSPKEAAEARAAIVAFFVTHLNP